jgi:hypothetical protein
VAAAGWPGWLSCGRERGCARPNRPPRTRGAPRLAAATSVAQAARFSSFAPDSVPTSPDFRMVRAVQARFSALGSGSAPVLSATAYRPSKSAGRGREPPLGRPVVPKKEGEVLHSPKFPPLPLSLQNTQEKSFEEAKRCHYS